jgi:hypothetical protein
VQQQCIVDCTDSDPKIGQVDEQSHIVSDGQGCDSAGVQDIDRDNLSCHFW